MKWLWCSLLISHNVFAACEKELEEVRRIGGELGYHHARGAEYEFIRAKEKQHEDAKQRLKQCQEDEIQTVQKRLENEKKDQDERRDKIECFKKCQEMIIHEAGEKLSQWIQNYESEGYPIKDNPDFDRDYEIYRQQVVAEMNRRLERSRRSHPLD